MEEKKKPAHYTLLSYSQILILELTPQTHARTQTVCNKERERGRTPIFVDGESREGDKK